MDTPDQPLNALIATAAGLRAAGETWDRHADTVRHWPTFYPDRWHLAFRAVESHLMAEAAVEARLTLRSLLRAKRGKHRLTAATQLLASNDHSRVAEAKTAAPPSADACPKCRELETMSDDDLERIVDHYRRAVDDEPVADGTGI